MKDSLTRANSEDFRRRYQQTFGLFNTPSKGDVLVQLTDVSPDAVYFQDSDGVVYHANADAGVPFQFFQVQHRLANFKDDKVLYLKRVPARMWKRGVCAENTSIVELTGGRRLSVSFPTLEVMFQDKYGDSINQFFKGQRKNVALNDQFAIMSGGIYIYDKPIGSYENGKAKISKLFKQEFMDLVKRNNFTIQVDNE